MSESAPTYWSVMPAGTRTPLRPFTVEVIRAQLESGEIRNEDLLWYPGQTTWVRADSIHWGDGPAEDQIDLPPQSPEVIAAASVERITRNLTGFGKPLVGSTPSPFTAQQLVELASAIRNKQTLAGIASLMTATALACCFVTFLDLYFAIEALANLKKSEIDQSVLREAFISVGGLVIATVFLLIGSRGYSRHRTGLATFGLIGFGWMLCRIVWVYFIANKTRGIDVVGTILFLVIGTLFFVAARGFKSIRRLRSCSQWSQEAVVFGQVHRLP